MLVTIEEFINLRQSRGHGGIVIGRERSGNAINLVGLYKNSPKKKKINYKNIYNIGNSGQDYIKWGWWNKYSNLT